MKKFKKRKNHMPLWVCNEQDELELIQIHDSLINDFKQSFDITQLPSRGKVIEWLDNKNYITIK